MGRLPWMLLFLVAIPAIPAQGQSWWSLSQPALDAEAGRLEELKDKRRVYIVVNAQSQDFEQVSSQSRRDLIRRRVVQSLAAYKHLEVVSTPERADFAFNITATQGPIAMSLPGNFSAGLDPNEQVGLTMLVLVRGSAQPFGDPRPRVVWDFWCDNVRSEPWTAAAFVIEGFLQELKRVRQER